MKKLSVLCCLLLLLVSGKAAAATDVFITDHAYRNKVEQAFNDKMKLVGQKFYDVKQLHPSEREASALRFLYAYMPVADVTDYPTSFFLENVRASFRAQQEMPWGKDVPELLFRHFVLPLRVNNENLDSARTVFYRELKDRVKSLSMTDAVLEVNHWCHEHVTYQPCVPPWDAAAKRAPFSWRHFALWAYLPGRCTRRVGHTPTTTMPGWRRGQTASGIFSAPANRSLCSTWHGSMRLPLAHC